MADIIDIRPDTFLRELSKGTPVLDALDKSGMNHDEIDSLLRTNSKFSLTVLEVTVDYQEDRLRKCAGELISVIQNRADEQIKTIHDQTEKAVMELYEVGRMTSHG